MEPLSKGRRQRGAVLFVTLIVLVVLMLAGVAVVRSMETSSQIAANTAFRQATMQAADRAIVHALNKMPSLVNDSAGNTGVANLYLATRSTNKDDFDTRGIPKAINWANVSCTNDDGTNGNCAANNGDYRFQYVIERQCSSNPTLTDEVDVKKKCAYELTGGAVEVRYRVYIRAQGPRGTESFYEVMLGGAYN
ncbi:pilus assembly PilX family protein [Crenobacter intestini]|uniref:Pilus assembly protein PilX n=1 Tax=Crenobacter intestini TaxID=2563443 RepID=A0A4T0V5G7_9NEIS|nr:PilX N-terminal domain-containing pilus assembly protein [Crenobacter intestini]TIC86988.1 hypothetical protein E5K04_00815 [Crenobacter intestini]